MQLVPGRMERISTLTNRIKVLQDRTQQLITDAKVEHDLDKAKKALRLVGRAKGLLDIALAEAEEGLDVAWKKKRG